MDSKISKSAHDRILRNCQKRDWGGQKNSQKYFLPLLSKGRLILILNPKTDCKNPFSSRSNKSLEFEPIRPPRSGFWPFLKSLSWAEFDLLESISIYIFVNGNKKNYHGHFFLDACSSSMCCTQHLTFVWKSSNS